MSALAPPEVVKTKTPDEELTELEERAADLGITAKELRRLRAIGCCPDQIQERIQAVRTWIAEKTQ